METFFGDAERLTETESFRTRRSEETALSPAHHRNEMCISRISRLIHFALQDELSEAKATINEIELEKKDNGKK